MASAKKTSRRLSVQTEQSEFRIKTRKVLTALLDDADVQEGDCWSFVDGGNDGLIIVRKRSTSQEFTEVTDE